jgi:hypothetical protein
MYTAQPRARIRTRENFEALYLGALSRANARKEIRIVSALVEKRKREQLSFVADRGAHRGWGSQFEARFLP